MSAHNLHTIGLGALGAHEAALPWADRLELVQAADMVEGRASVEPVLYDAVRTPQMHAGVGASSRARDRLRGKVRRGVRGVVGVEWGDPVRAVAVQAEAPALVLRAVGVQVAKLEACAHLPQDRLHLRRADERVGPEAARAERAVRQQVLALAVEVPGQRARRLLLPQLPLLAQDTPT